MKKFHREFHWSDWTIRTFLSSYQTDHPKTDLNRRKDRQVVGQADRETGREADRKAGRQWRRQAGKKQTGILASTCNSPWRKTEIYLPFQQQETVHVLLNSNILILDLNRNMNGEKASQFLAYFIKHLYFVFCAMTNMMTGLERIKKRLSCCCCSKVS